MNQITITYNTSVMVGAGWRHVTIKAIAEKTSEKMATVTYVLEIDGKTPMANMSRTGAKRQSYYGLGITKREIGARKRLSACKVEA